MNGLAIYGICQLAAMIVGAGVVHRYYRAVNPKPDKEKPLCQRCRCLKTDRGCGIIRYSGGGGCPRYGFAIPPKYCSSFSPREPEAHEIDKQPTVDDVKVVRCKDCWHHNNCGIEQAALAPIGFFCALGERKDDAK